MLKRGCRSGSGIPLWSSAQAVAVPAGINRYRGKTQLSEPQPDHLSSLSNKTEGPEGTAAAAEEEGEWKSSYDPILAAVLSKIYVGAERLEGTNGTQVSTDGKGTSATAALVATTIMKEQKLESFPLPKRQPPEPSPLPKREGTVRPVLSKLISLTDVRRFGLSQDHAKTWDSSAMNVTAASRGSGKKSNQKALPKATKKQNL